MEAILSRELTWCFMDPGRNIIIITFLVLFGVPIFHVEMFRICNICHKIDTWYLCVAGLLCYIISPLWIHVRLLPQYRWSNPERYGWIDWCPSTTKHSTPFEHTLTMTPLRRWNISGNATVCSWVFLDDKTKTSKIYIYHPSWWTSTGQWCTSFPYYDASTSEFVVDKGKFQTTPFMLIIISRVSILTDLKTASPNWGLTENKGNNT